MIPTLLAVMMAALPSCSTGQTSRLVFSVKTWEGEYFSRDIPGGVETSPVVGAIYTVDGDGANLQKIAQLGKNTDFPNFSPDGKWVYFQSNATGRSHVYRCRPDGSGIVNLTEGDRLGKQWKDAYGYALSRDGSQLLYTVHDGSSGRVALAKPDGAEPRLLFAKLGYTYMGNLRRLTTGNRYLHFKLSAADRHGSTDAPHVSPDGQRIAYVAVKEGVPNVCVMNVDGSGQRQVTFRKTSCGRARWSPDGKQIAFVSFEGKYPQLFTVPVEKGEPRQLTRLEGAVYFVNWIP